MPEALLSFNCTVNDASI